MLLDAVSAQLFSAAALVGTTEGTAATVRLDVLEELQSGVAGVPSTSPSVGDELGTPVLPGTLGSVVWADGAPAVALPQPVADQWVAEAAARNSLGAPSARAFADDAGLVFAFALG